MHQILAPSFPFSPLSMEINGMNQTNTPTFYTKGTKTLENPLLGTALHEALPSFQGSRRRGTTRKRREYLKAQNKDSLSKEQDEEIDDEDEKKEVKRKIVALQRIVPGGEELGADKLFEETAEYILALQCQIRAMRVLTSFIEGVEKQKTKLGG